MLQKEPQVEPVGRQTNFWLHPKFGGEFTGIGFQGFGGHTFQYDNQIRGRTKVFQESIKPLGDFGIFGEQRLSRGVNRQLQSGP